MATPTLHQRRTHPEPVPGCERCRWSSIGVKNWARSAKGERQILHGLIDETEIERYRQLRAQGIQPQGTRWPDLERAEAASRYRDEAYNATTDPLDATKDWGDGAGDWEQAEAPVEGRDPVTVPFEKAGAVG